MEVYIGLLGLVFSSGTALAIAALGLLINEKAGIVNLGAEGMMLCAAVAGVMVTVGTGSTWLGLGAGILTIPQQAHTYVDDDPTGTSADLHTITVTVTDDDTGTASNTALVTINNVAPSAIVITPSAPINVPEVINKLQSRTRR